jgi:hypothetical protein
MDKGQKYFFYSSRGREFKPHFYRPATLSIASDSHVYLATCQARVNAAIPIDCDSETETQIDTQFHQALP